MPKSRAAQWLTDAAAAFGGRNETNVANATDEPIRVTVSEKEIHIDNANVSSDGQISVNLKEEEQQQSVTIQPGETHRFDRDNTRDRMTVEKPDSDTTPIENMPIPTNQSYIVTDTGIVRQDYGNPNLFEDEHGNDHSK